MAATSKIGYLIINRELSTANKNQLLISVIVPIYNGHDYMPACVESVLSQTHENIEVLLVDDASTDDSLKLAKNFAERDKRVRVLERKKNGGQSAARNTGVAEARGEWIAFIDNDDTYEPEFLETLLRNAREHKVKVSGCANNVYRDGQHFVADINGKPSGKFSAEELVIKILYKPAYTWPEVGNKIYHHSLKPLLNFPEGAQLEDYLVTLPVLYTVGQAYFDNTPLYNGNVRKCSQSAQLFFENRLTYWQSTEGLRNGFIEKRAPQQYIDAVYAWEYGVKCRLLEDMVRTGDAENKRRAKEMLPEVNKLRKHIHVNTEFTGKSAIHCWLRLMHVKFA